MVDTNHEPVDKKEPEVPETPATEAKKKKEPVKKDRPKTAAKTAPKTNAGKIKAEEKGVVKKLPVKKETSGKGQSPAKAPVPANKQTLANLKKFVKGSWSELKKVHWPNRRELVAYTGVVLATVVFVALMIFAVDSLLSRVVNFILPK